MQWAFDVGHLFVTPTVGGSPIRIGSLRGVTIDVERQLTLERLAFQTPVKAAHSQTRLKGKAKTAQINGALFAETFFGQASSTGSVKGVDGCENTIPASPGPYTITITPPNSGTFLLDLGVGFAADAPQLVLVSGTPAAGQYAVSGNVYTFAAADVGKTVLISYSYTLTTGRKLAIQNQYWIEAPFFRLTGFAAYNGKQIYFDFPSCVTAHLSIATVLENWTMPDFDFEIISNPQGLVGTISTAE